MTPALFAVLFAIVIAAELVLLFVGLWIIYADEIDRDEALWFDAAPWPTRDDTVDDAAEEDHRA